MTDLKDPKTDFETNNMPNDPSSDDKTCPTKLKLWEMRIKRYLDREKTLYHNITKLYAVIIGQCTPALKSTIKGDSESEEKSKKFDALWSLLFKLII